MNFICVICSWMLLAYSVLGQECTTVSATQNITWTIRGVSTTDQKYLTVNNKWPAAPIEINRCSRLLLTVVNLCGADVTLHFHGLLQSNGQTIMDGAQGLSQSAIPNKKSYTYTVMTSEAGTYWIHSHAPGQYPQGLRAPLIVRQDIDKTFYKYTSEQTVTLSDWWSNFTYAEERSLATFTNSDPNIGTCGDPGTIGYGIEYPPAKVTFNDVGGHSATLNNAQKTYKTVKIAKCGENKRIRLINMSSHSRFYVAFSDSRKFDVIELDGILYTPKSTTWLELSSGQRASILVNGKSSTQSDACAPAYIVTLSDPKVSHGTKRCNMVFTDPNYGIQYTHGYLDVNNQAVAETVTLATSAFPNNWSRVWAFTDDINQPSFQPWPSRSWDPTDQASLRNRMQLPYNLFYANPNNINDYGFQSTAARNLISVASIGSADELAMTPNTTIGAWYPPADASELNARMHYFTLGTVDTSVASNVGGSPGNGGYAAMGEYVGTSSSSNKLLPWKSPDEQESPVNIDNPQWPSVIRALRSDLTDTQVNSAETYVSSKNVGNSAKGRTTVLTDTDNSRAHWFIIRSVVGDHPMHLHGHHFQVLAKLPAAWFDQNNQILYNHVTSGSIVTDGKANPNNPPRRDTIMIEKGFTYVLAILPDNPGVWALHCHNDIHSVSGMFTQIIERPLTLRKNLGTWSLSASLVTPGAPVQYTMAWNENSKDASIADPIWRSRAELSTWMVAKFDNAIDRYGLRARWSATKNTATTRKMRRLYPPTI